jgi:hypothetical protein
MSLEVSNLQLSKSTCKPGESVTVSFSVTNPTSRFVVARVTVTVNGSVATVDYVSIPANSTVSPVNETITAPSAAGSYSVCVSAEIYEAY